jgi:hypothetical protein
METDKLMPVRGPYDLNISANVHKKMELRYENNKDRSEETGSENNLQNNYDTFPLNAEMHRITGELWVFIIFSL